MGQKCIISSSSNTQVKNIVLLQKKAKAREEQGLFIVEGIKMFEEALDAGDILVKAYFSESFYHAMQQQNPKYFTAVDYEIITDTVFNEISETKTPQGVLALAKTTSYTIEEISQSPNINLVILEDIRDPGNLGTILRTAEGAGVTGVIMSKSCVDIYNPKVIRSTMGSIYRVPFYYANDLYLVIKDLKKQGVHMFAAHLLGKPYDTKDIFKGKCAIMIGNEANGLTKEASSLADELIKIPMYGKVESLNAAIAAAILMYEVARQRRE